MKTTTLTPVPLRQLRPGQRFLLSPADAIEWRVTSGPGWCEMVHATGKGEMFDLDQTVYSLEAN